MSEWLLFNTIGAIFQIRTSYIQWNDDDDVSLLLDQIAYK
jgi:hypothetical protein